MTNINKMEFSLNFTINITAKTERKTEKNLNPSPKFLLEQSMQFKITTYYLNP